MSFWLTVSGIIVLFVIGLFGGIFLYEATKEKLVNEKRYYTLGLFKRGLKPKIIMLGFMLGYVMDFTVEATRILLKPVLEIAFRPLYKPKTAEHLSPLKEVNLRSIKYRGLNYLDKSTENEEANQLEYNKEKIVKILGKLNSSENLTDSELGYFLAHRDKYYKNIEKEKLT